MTKLTEYQRKDFVSLITKLNTKIIYLQREKSKRGFQGKSDGYKAKVCKDMILRFLQKDCKHPLDEAPSIKQETLFNFRKRISQMEDDI